MSGISTVGWITNLGNKEVKDVSLLTTVKDLLTGLLSSDPEKAGMLLSLVGIAPSAILGCNMDCSSVSVEAGKMCIRDRVKGYHNLQESFANSKIAIEYIDVIRKIVGDANESVEDCCLLYTSFVLNTCMRKAILQH